jgi:hypothetical protein
MGRRRCEPRIRLVVTDHALLRHLRGMARDAGQVFPEATPLQAAYPLFRVHLDEALATRVLDGSTITSGPGGLDVDPVRAVEPLPKLHPDGVYSWSAEPPRGEHAPEFMCPQQHRAKYGREPVLRTEGE